MLFSKTRGGGVCIGCWSFIFADWGLWIWSGSGNKLMGKDYGTGGYEGNYFIYISLLKKGVD